MRRLTYLLLLAAGISGGLSSPTLASPKTISYTCDISPQVLEYILKSAAKELGMTYEEVQEKYEDGSCTILQLSPKVYKVTTGGGSIIILDDTL